MSGPLGRHPLSYDSMADPDLQTRKRGPAGHPRPEMTFGPQFGLKIRGGPPPLDPPLPFLQTTTSCKRPLRYSHFGWSLMGRTLGCKYIITNWGWLSLWVVTDHYPKSSTSPPSLMIPPLYVGRKLLWSPPLLLRLPSPLQSLQRN